MARLAKRVFETIAVVSLAWVVLLLALRAYEALFLLTVGHGGFSRFEILWPYTVAVGAILALALLLARLPVETQGTKMTVLHYLLVALSLLLPILLGKVWQFI
jgi:steroid 5-alpha reductase family enzyme